MPAARIGAAVVESAFGSDSGFTGKQLRNGVPADGGTVGSDRA